MSETKKTAGKAKASPGLGCTGTQGMGTVVYIGPDIPGAKQYTTYNAGLPDALKEKIKEHPFFNSLVVPVRRLAKANAELAKEGSALSVLYKKACALRKNKEEG